MNRFDKKKTIIGIIGLGYVGLPLAVEFGKKFPTYGFDVRKKRIDQLKKYFDNNLEITKKDIKSSNKITFTNDLNDLKSVNYFIVTVPTPVDKKNNPDLSLVLNACRMIAKFLKVGDIVIFESTVYPGATENEFVDVLEKYSGLKFNQDFFCGYSPERINPGDKLNKITKIKKITSGSTLKISEIVDKLYKQIITAGTFKAKDIMTAEAAKVIENIQRDVNIALMNELVLVFNKLNVNIFNVLDAANTKWNFLSFYPGLVGGHCVSVDPYYLINRSLSAGFNPRLIREARKLNNGMSSYIVSKIKIEMKKKRIRIKNSNILILGLAFKENCVDFRNSQVIKIHDKLKRLKVNVSIFDPLVDKFEVKNNHSIA
jgi:UDP-N-acetyl-D-galactosamine dehydrogenase